MKGVLLVVLCACSQNDEPPKQGLETPQARLVGTAVKGAFDSSSQRTSLDVHQKLFADDVPAGELALTIGIETIGDIATPLFQRGTRLPVSHTEVFSTAADDQSQVEVNVLQGERPLASQNRSLGKFQLFGIPPATRGVPQIEVTFAVDGDGVLTVSARDKATGQSKQVTISGRTGALDKAAVDKMLADAQAEKADDDLRRDWAQAKNDLDQLIYSSRSLLTAGGGKLSQTTRARVQREIDADVALLKLSTKPENPALLRGVIESLHKTMRTVSEELYKAAR
jgi:molecular chaperone DnaK